MSGDESRTVREASVVRAIARLPSSSSLVARSGQVLRARPRRDGDEPGLPNSRDVSSLPQSLSLAAAIDVDVVGVGQAFLHVRSGSSPTTPSDLVGAPVAAYDLTGNRLRVRACIQIHLDGMVGRQKGAVRAKARRDGQAGAYQDGPRYHDLSVAHINRTPPWGKSSA